MEVKYVVIAAFCDVTTEDCKFIFLVRESVAPRNGIYLQATSYT